MKHVLAALALVSLVGCASVSKRMDRLSFGMPRAEVVEILGSPDHTRVDGDVEALIYEEQPFGAPLEYYAVALKDGKAIRYGDMDYVFPPSQEELDRRARVRAAAAQMMMGYWQSRAQQQQSQPSYQPMQIYQPQRQQQINCQSRVVGGTVYSDCDSRPTGIDTSIYNIGR